MKQPSLIQSILMLVGLILSSVVVLVAGFILFVALTEEKDKPEVKPVKPEREILKPIDSKEKVKVVIIDTGIRKDKRIEPFLCKESFDASGKGIEDRNGHGTHIASIIAQGLDTSKYCLYIVKFFDYYADGDSMTGLLKSLAHVKTLSNVYVVNMSLSGSFPDSDEKKLIKGILNKNIRINVAAGNEGLDLNKGCQAYPACYDFDRRLFHVVGANYTNTKIRANFSNYGKAAKFWEDGTRIKTWAGTQSGTSQATAVHTRNMLKD